MSHALIVGGTRGLGRAIAQALKEHGHTLSLIGRRQPVDADRDLGRHWVADVLDEAALFRAVDEALAQGGPLNYLVFCQRFRGTEDAWAGEIAVSLTATKRIVERLQGSFGERGDKGIVLVSSVFGSMVGEGQPLGYHVCKAGMEQMARYFAVEMGRKGIRVNVVTPFTFLKEESKQFYLNNKPLLDLYGQIVPLGRIGTTEDSARVIRFLCGPDAAYVTGQNIFVDGGLSLLWPETLARKLAGI